MQSIDYPNAETYPVETPLDYENNQTVTHDTSQQASHPLDAIDWKALIKFLLVCFAYAWWAVIVVYFGLLAESASLYLQVVSLPIIVASLALARLFQMAIKAEAFGFSLLFFSGLLVAGMLA